MSSVYYVAIFLYIFGYMHNKHISQVKSIYYFIWYAAIKAHTRNAYEAKLKLYVHVLLHWRCYATGVPLPFSHLFSTRSSSPFSPIYLSPFVYIILNARFAQAHARTRDVFAGAPNSEYEAHDDLSLSLSLSSLSPSRVRLYTTACIYTSYIITPDGASTSRTLGKAPHDSVYLLNTEYNVSPAYTYTWTLALPPLKETYSEGPFTMPHMVETCEVALHNKG